MKSSPDIIEMTFCPITALLDEMPAKEHLTRAIGLYLECKSIYPLLFIIFNFFHVGFEEHSLISVTHISFSVSTNFAHS